MVEHADLLFTLVLYQNRLPAKFELALIQMYLPLF